MTIFGPDISNYEAGLDLSRLQNASFVIAKCSEGTYYVDKSYQAWRRQAQAARTLFAWYHFLTRENTAAQVANNKASVGDLSLPGMLDIEPAYGYSPTLAQVIDYIDQAHAAGLNLRLAYLPRWFWEQWGEPDLGEIGARGVHLVNSSYPGGQGTAPQIYPGDEAAGWRSMGGLPIALYQFTNQALDGGQRMDYNAYHGTVDQLHELFYGDNTPTGGPDVNLTDTVTVSQGFATRYPQAGPDGFTAGAQINVATLLEGSAIRAANNEHLLTAILARVGGGVDVGALAAQLGPLLHPTTDVNALAAALAPHVGVPDPAAFAAALVPHIKVESA